MPLKGLSESVTGVARAVRKPEDCLHLLRKEYECKWKARSAQRIENITEFTSRLRRDAISITPADVRQAFAKVKMKGRLDTAGVSPKALELLSLACPDEFCLWLQMFLCDEQSLKDFTIAARVYSKTGTHPLSADTRVILPLGAIGGVCDAILAEKLQEAVDKIWGVHVVQWQGARSGTQCLEIASSAHIALERFADDAGQGCIGQADVRRYYDSVDLLRVGRCLSSRGADDGIVRAVLNFQMLPGVTLNCPFGTVAIHSRTLGTLTGSRCAGVLGQIPVLDICELESTFLQAHAWTACGNRSPVMTWVDNLFWFAKSIYSAVAIGARLEDRLKVRWNLQLKADSKILQPGLGNPEMCDGAVGWSILPSTPYLGHIVQTSGSIRACWQTARTKMWRAFWANSGSTMGKKLPLPAKIALLQRCVACVVAFRMSRWPPQTQIARELDAVQARMTALILGLKPNPTEDSATFLRHRAKAARQSCRIHGLWSQLWFRRAKAWDDHLSRHPQLLASAFRNFNDSNWLILRRANYANINSIRRNSWTTFAGRTATRAAAGFVATRWQAGIQLANNRIRALV
jgi:hypothetical protein